MQIALLENRARAQPNVARIPALDSKERIELGISAEPYDVAERGDPQNLLSEHSLAKFMYRAHDPMKLHKEQERPGVWNPLYRYPSTYVWPCWQIADVGIGSGSHACLCEQLVES